MAVATAKRILSPGARIAGYRIEAEIGHGAMAVVYRARQLNLDRPVALKVLSDELAANHEFVSRFFNEARAAAALSHAHIVQAYDAGIAEGGIHFFAMEYVEGETLQQRIRRQGYVRPGPGIEMAIDVADALNYGWLRQRLTHGDIKPDNIMINQAGDSKLADFGLAKVDGHDFTGSDIMLTPLYAAPEVIRGEQAKGDCRSDIYSFGATLYDMFGGTPPFPGEKAQEVMQRHLNETLEPLRQRNPAVPGRISDLVGGLLRKDAAERPADWEAVLASLRDVRKALTEPPASKLLVAGASPIKLRAVRQARPTLTVPQRRGLGRWVALGILLLLAGSAAVVVAKRRPGVRPPPRTLVAPSAASAGPAPVTALPASGRTVAEPWEEVRRQTLAESDPERALARLEDFAKSHAGEELPTAYAALLAKCQGEVRKRSAALDPAAGAPGEERTSEGPEAVAGLPSETAPGAAPGALEGAEGAALAVPAEGRSDPEKTLPEPTGAVSAAAVQGQDLVTPSDLRTDAFVAYMGRLASFEYRLPLRLEATMKEGQEWLLNFNQDSAERAAVAFVLSTVLPALDEALPKLVANPNALVGMKIPGREYKDCTVASIDVKEIMLREQTQYGVVSRKLAWQRLDNPAALILHLSQKLALRGASWGDRRPFLALMLLSRNAKLFDDAVRDLPEAPERADWERLRTGLTRATAESEALRLWQKALEARRESEGTAAYRLLLKLQATRSGVSERYGERVGKLTAELALGVPEVAGGALVRESAAQVDADAATALVKILLASTRYGAADFPEKADLESLRRRAVAGLPEEAWVRQYLQPLRRQPQDLILPFARPASPGIPSLAMRMLQAQGESSDNGAAAQADKLAILEGPSLLELGDWAGAERLVSKWQANALAPLPPPARAAAWFSRGLTDSRFGVTNERAITEALRQCSRELADKADSEFVLLPQVLALEYGLFLRCGDADVQSYLSSTEALKPRGPTADLRCRLILDLAALSLDRRQAETVGRLSAAVLATLASAADWGLDDLEVALVRLAMARSKDAKALGAAMAKLDVRVSTEWHLRLVVSAALAREPLDEGVWRSANEWINEKGMSFGPVGGTAVYDLALARIGQLLAADNLKGADDTAAWALALTYPCMAPYYARLTFVRWGLARLRRGAGNRELSEQVEAAAAANREEKTLARLFRGEAQRDKAKEAVRDHAEGKFWFDWLTATERLGGVGNKEARKSLERFGSSRLPRAEQILANGVVDWGERSSPGNPGQGRGKPTPP